MSNQPPPIKKFRDLGQLYVATYFHKIVLKGHEREMNYPCEKAAAELEGHYPSSDEEERWGPWEEAPPPPPPPPNLFGEASDFNEQFVDFVHHHHGSSSSRHEGGGFFRFPPPRSRMRLEEEVPRSHYDVGVSKSPKFVGKRHLQGGKRENLKHAAKYTCFNFHNSSSKTQCCFDM